VKIGLIGYGVVGDALLHALKSRGSTDEFIIVDPAKSDRQIQDLADTEMVFVCVPTPTGPVCQDARTLQSVWSDLGKIFYRGIVVLKSTTTPTNTGYLVRAFPKLNTVANPEFLTEANARQDCLQSPFIVLGGPELYCHKLEEYYRQYWPASQYVLLTRAEAAMFAKYMVNAFLATKVSFMNEMYDLWNKISGTGWVPSGIPGIGPKPDIWNKISGTGWEGLVQAFSADLRVGRTHLQVPGPDGKFGFGGKCFPKDLKAILYDAKCLGSVRFVLQGALDTNERVRNK
jgi:UDPglucose 6-dehydrogenase